MNEPAEPIEIIALKTFSRAVKKLLNEDQLAALSDALQVNPEAGDVIKGTGGVRKMRWALNQGKSGGLRVIYFYQDAKGRLFLISAYAKGRKENLSKAELNDLKKLTDELKGML